MIFRLDLTPHQRAAFLTVISDYVARNDGVEVSIDAATGTEIEISDLLKVLLNAPPIPISDTEQLQTLEAAQAAGWRIETDWQKIKARYSDLDLADAVPRPIIYTDIGVLVGTIARLSKRRPRRKE